MAKARESSIKIFQLIYNSPVNRLLAKRGQWHNNCLVKETFVVINLFVMSSPVNKLFTVFGSRDKFMLSLGAILALYYWFLMQKPIIKDRIKVWCLQIFCRFLFIYVCIKNFARLGIIRLFEYISCGRVLVV